MVSRALLVKKMGGVGEQGGESQKFGGNFPYLGHKVTPDRKNWRKYVFWGVESDGNIRKCTEHKKTAVYSKTKKSSHFSIIAETALHPVGLAPDIEKLFFS